MRVRSVLLHDGIDERVTQHRRLLQSLITPQSSSLCHCHDGAWYQSIDLYHRPI